MNCGRHSGRIPKIDVVLVHVGYHDVVARVFFFKHISRLLIIIYTV